MHRNIVNPLTVVMTLSYQPSSGGGRMTEWRAQRARRLSNEQAAKVLSAIMECITENVASRRDSLEDSLELADGIRYMIHEAMGDADTAISRARAVSCDEDWEHPGRMTISRKGKGYCISVSDGISAGVFALLAGMLASIMLAGTAHLERFRTEMLTGRRLRRDVELYHYAHMESRTSASVHHADEMTADKDVNKDDSDKDIKNNEKHEKTYRSVRLLRDIRFDDYRTANRRTEK